ncbi:PIN/TRAM domain-containing protein [Blastopirellula marina]|uniref:PIN/TRAM domain-containing protein n=1 Tax=Blastopirellula marina TaxID=124 RepID=A0A2S8F4K4_9BACT|nr:PIN domain-containing protein [Blastopirellula marina]PQO27088.1 PIN/TRAM domain-containing protein [Blastopirellula marina]PTL41235.1 PIN/TRAM domain-containing protein [Blastopirellula marina]
MALIVLRFVFMLVAAGVGITLIKVEAFQSVLKDEPWWAFLGIMVLALGVIGIDVGVKQKRYDTISGVYFGLLVGLSLTYILGLITQVWFPADNPSAVTAHRALQLVIGMVLCYMCISLVLQTKDDFRFIIPYVEFAKEVKGPKPYVLDTSIVIDGRIADVVETGFFDNVLIMPRFVLAELQGIADSSDKLKRSRGRRGLDILNRLRNNDRVDLKIHDRETPDMEGQPVDMKLVLLAKLLEGKIVTGDYNLNKVAKLHNVDVINLNEIANALKPVFLPGEHLSVRIVKKGEEESQGVGYLDDGTMIVVEGGRDHINSQVRILVTSVLQTSAGRMIFGRYEAVEGSQGGSSGGGHKSHANT